MTSRTFRDVIEFDTKTEKWYTIHEAHRENINTLLVSVDNRCMMVQSGSDIIRFDPKTTPKRDRDYRVENYHKKVVGKAHEFDTFLPQSTEYEGNVYWMGY